MKMLKVGDRYINLDLVTDILVANDGITIYLAVGPTANPNAVPSPYGMSNMTQGVRALTFRDEDAQNLQRWLDSSDNSVDVKPKTMGRGAMHGSAKRQE